ncbi:MAG: antibiotic biosynthesis monooxygenase [Acidobacteriaceae bacterium]|nr:antibiotic biosynthesis monooxygenase [Acidobacteriaceae bacterium]MBV8572137.1 antibiotic biosynthesis monooxygenase [Acidobacteriaceae bacterium]
MVIMHIHIRVKPEFIEEFRAATIENARNSVKEPGIARFDFLQHAEEPDRFVLIEVYRTPDAPALHRETPHYKSWRDRAEPMMAEPRTRIRLDNVFPDDTGW